MSDIKKILVYADYGANDLCVLFSIKLLMGEYPQAWIRKIFADLICEKSLF